MGCEVLHKTLAGGRMGAGKDRRGYSQHDGTWNWREHGGQGGGLFLTAKHQKQHAPGKGE